MSQTFPPVRLAALDLDGTLLNHEGQVTPRTRAALQAASDRGVVIVPTTGRPLGNLPPVVAQLPGVRYAITSNGAAVWDLGSDPLGAVYSRYANAAERQTSEPTCLLRRLMPVETARAAFDLFMEYPGGMGVFWNGYSVKDQASGDFAAARWARLHSTEARQPNDGRFLVVRDLGEWMSRHAHEVEKQCLFFAEQDQVPQALARFRAMPGVEVVQGSPENIEVTAAGVDKGEALLTLADRLGIPRAQTLAVGDSENDRAMLEKAGVAAVMANGMPQIKALADLVTTADCDHDGVAEILETLGI